MHNGLVIQSNIPHSVPYHPVQGSCIHAILIEKNKSISELWLPRNIEGKYTFPAIDAPIFIVADDSRWKAYITNDGYFTSNNPRKNNTHLRTRELFLRSDSLYLAQVGKRVFSLYIEASDDVSKVFHPYYPRKNQDIFIGRDSSCDIQYHNCYVSREHAILKCVGNQLIIIDNHSANGVYVNGKQIKTAELQPGDAVNILGLCIIVAEDYIAINNADKFGIMSDSLVPLDKKIDLPYLLHSNLKPEFSAGKTSKISGKRPVKAANYPWFERREFVGTELRKEPYVIEKLPEIGTAPSINWMQVLAAPAAMGMIAVIMMAAGMSNMLMMLPMQLVGVITAVFSYYSQKKKYNKSSNNREEKYKEYLAEAEAELEKLAQDQRNALGEANPTGASCMDIIRNRNGILWSRDMQSENFLEISLGVGQSELSCPINVHRPGRFDQEVNALSQQAVDLADRYKQIQEVPITFSLLKNNAIAVVGNQEHRTALLQQMLISLSTLHTPEDLRIAIVYSREEEQAWSFFRFLPHVWDANRTMRLIAGCDTEAEALLNHFADLAESRQRDSEAYRASVPTPFYVLVITNPEYLNQITNPGRLLPHSSANGMTTLIATGSNIPSGCRHIIEVKADRKNTLQGNAFPTSDRNRVTQFSATPLLSGEAEKIVRAMAPIRLRAGKEGKGMPPFISLFKGRSISKTEEMRIEDAWKNFRAVDSMAVSLGVGSDGKEVIFDIHEKHDGPMGLVAGTTRAGKTELLQTWIIQMASKFSPEEVNFVLFDFKGTSLIDPLKALPHLVGEISNTGPDDSGQDFELRYCTALRSEITRRQELLSQTCSTNILDYQRKYHNHQVIRPMPFLMIILDEFARIKDKHPDFMKLANELYATGGSLGMYVILSTQNPASAISPEIRANSAFQLCARVADNQDSREMIGVPDAAHLPKIPGRAFLRVQAQGTLRCFQSYYAGAAYDAETHRSENAMPTALIEANGNALTVKTAKPDFTELEATVEHICQTAKNMRIPDAHKVWRAPLEKKISIYDILNTAPGEESLHRKIPAALTAVIGLTDDPARQDQYKTELSFAQYGSAVVCGGPSSGKTNFLLTAAISLVHLYSPERIRMYFIDGSGGALKCMEKFPHTSRSLNAHTQPEDCAKILLQLHNEVKVRQQKLAAQGVQDIISYRKMPVEAIPDVLLIIDDIGEVKKSLEAIKFSDAVEIISYLLKFGRDNGIYLLISACKQQELYKLSDNIRPEMRFILQMPDRTDARDMLGLPVNPPIITIPGRGLCIGASGEKRPLVFQTALPWTVDDPAIQMTQLQKLGQEMTNRCGLTFEDQPKEIPEHISYGSISALEHGLVLGLALDGSGVIGNYSDPDTSVLTLVGSDVPLRLSVTAMVAKQVAQSGRYDKEFVLSARTAAIPVLEELRADVKANMIPGGPQEKYFLVIHDFPEVYCRLPEEQRTLLDKFVLHGGTRYGIDCLFTAAPKQLAELPENDGGVTPASITLFRRPMLYLDSTIATSNVHFRTDGQKSPPMGEEDAEYVTGFSERRHSVRIRRMLDR